METTTSVGALKQGRRRGVDLLRDGLIAVGAILMAVTLYLVFFYVPTDAILGISQRIFYLHVPIAMLGLLSIVVVAIASGAHLVTRGPRTDAAAYAAAEVGLLFCTIALVTGAIWAKPAWGVWWTWDPKLTLTVALWFIYVSYLMLRAYGPKGSRGARYGAVLALIGAVDAPLIYYAAELWRSLHPNLVLGPSAPSDALAPAMVVGILVSIAALLSMFAFMTLERYCLRMSEADIDEAYRRSA